MVTGTYINAEIVNLPLVLPEWLWGPPSLLSNEYPGGKAAGAWNWPFTSV